MIWLINSAARVLSLLILLRVVLSWLDTARRSEYFRLLAVLTDPMLAPFRRIFYRPGMRLDFSPLVALICLEILRGLAVNLLSLVYW